MKANRSQLSDLEVGIIKGLFTHYPKRFTNQAILSKFSVPVRTVNSGRISEIKNRHKHADILPASKDEVDKFLSGETKLHELARELFPMREALQIAFGGIEYAPVTREVSTPESTSLDYKERYESASLHAYLKILASMVNAGQETGSIVFGIADKPPKIVGVQSDSVFLMEKWRQAALNHFAPFFGVYFQTEHIGNDENEQVTIVKAQLASPPPPPIICEKSASASENGSNKSILREGAIYYRYADSTREIRYAELRILIDRLKNCD